MYSIRSAGAKGLGVFATGRIPAGTRILAERPLLTVQSENEAYIASTKLQHGDRSWFQGLTTNGHARASILDSITASWQLLRGKMMPNAASIGNYHAFLTVFRNNNFDIGEGRQAMFREISRLNHSCVPNSQGNFNEALGQFTIHALRPIDADDEITISYLVEHAAVRDARQAQLYRRYGFDCDCPICAIDSPVANRSEQQRSRMRDRVQKDAKLAALSGKVNIMADLQILAGMIELWVDEGLAGRELSTMYLSAAEKSASLGLREDARRYAALGIEAEEMCLGIDNPMYQESVQRMERILAGPP